MDIDKRIEEIFKEIKELLFQKKHEEALKLLQAILVMDPNNEEAIYVSKKIKNLINNENKSVKPEVIIYGYTELFAINPDVKITFNDEEIGKVSRNETFTFQAPKKGIIHFKSTILFVSSQTSISIEGNKREKVQLYWSKFSNALKAKFIE